MTDYGQARRPAPTSTVRSFIAIELPPHVLALLRTVQDELRESLGDAAEAIKWVRPEGIHLTLQFLGDVRTDRLGQIEQVMKQASANVAPFELTMRELGAFPD